MENQKLKRPVLPAIFLSLSIPALLLLNLISGVIIIPEIIGSIINITVPHQLPEILAIIVSNFASSTFKLLYFLTFAVSSIFGIVLVVDLIFKKKNKMLPISIGLYSLLPLGMTVMSIIKCAVPFAWHCVYILTIALSRSRSLDLDLLNRVIHYARLHFSAEGLFSSIIDATIPNAVGALAYILWLLATAIVLIIAFSACDKPLIKAPKLQKTFKKLFWAPAALYALAIPFFIVPYIILAFNALSSSLQNYSILDALIFILDITHWTSVPAILSLTSILLVIPFTLLFFITLGWWLFKPYKKNKKAVANVEAADVEAPAEETATEN